MEPQDLAWVALVAIVPLAIILIIALLRGYDIFIHFHRNGRRYRRDD